MSNSAGSFLFYCSLKPLISDRLLLYFADSANIKTTKTTKTKPAISENIVWNGCPWKKLSSDLLRCIKVFTANLLGGHQADPLQNLWLTASCS